MRRRYIQVETEDGWELVDASLYVAPPKNETAYIWGDLKPYKPMGGDEAKAFLTGDKPRMIEGRKQHREYLRKNGFIEVGNEKEAFFKYGGKTKENHEKYAPYAAAKGSWDVPDGRLKR